MKVAVVGSGIAGLAAAYTLLREGDGRVQLTLFEAGSYFGGHTHTVGTRAFWCSTSAPTPS
jgi:uncharacterized protein